MHRERSTSTIGVFVFWTIFIFFLVTKILQFYFSLSKKTTHGRSPPVRISQNHQKFSKSSNKSKQNILNNFNFYSVKSLIRKILICINLFECSYSRTWFRKWKDHEISSWTRCMWNLMKWLNLGKRGRTEQNTKWDEISDSRSNWFVIMTRVKNKKKK